MNWFYWFEKLFIESTFSILSIYWQTNFIIIIESLMAVLVHKLYFGYVYLIIELCDFDAHMELIFSTHNYVLRRWNSWTYSTFYIKC